MEVNKLIEAAKELRRLGVLINQSLRVSGGQNVDMEALNLAAKRINNLWP
jgi:hypothetical protein